MLTIQLINLRFYAYHGLYEEEKILGGEYEVNVDLSYQETKRIITHINETIDYSLVYQLVKAHMQQPQLLLETIATTIAEAIFLQFAMAEEITISIKKLQPPIVAFQGSVGISYTAKRNSTV